MAPFEHRCAQISNFASRHNDVQLFIFHPPDVSAPAALASLLFDPPDPSCPCFPMGFKHFFFDTPFLLGHTGACAPLG